MHFCVIEMDTFSKKAVNLIQLRWYRLTPPAHGLYRSFFMIRGLICLNALLSNIYAFLTSYKSTWNSNIVMET